MRTNFPCPYCKRKLDYTMPYFYCYYDDCWSLFSYGTIELMLNLKAQGFDLEVDDAIQQVK